MIARFEATFPGGGAPPTASAATQAVVLTVAQPYANHNGGMLEFGPDDMLYVGLGDGGSANDPHGNAQDPGTLLGSILRIDPRGSATYTVPTDNPFFGTAGVAPETWAYGVRNAWRFSFDRANGDFWLGDVGQWSREEVDRVAPGENLGWPVYEGHRSNANPGGLPPSAFTAPVVDYARAEGSCVIGGYVYRGTDVPELTGSYVYGDNGSGRIWALVHDGTSLTVPPVWIATLPGLTSFGEDDDAELYAVSHSGTIVKITPDPGDPPPPFPQKLSDTGLFTDTAALVPTAGLIEYDVAAPLWSDDALKRRWVGVPGTARITFQPVGAWLFPLGTVFVKHFELPLVAGDPSSAKRLETRVFLRETEGWAGYTYRWNEGGTDADLLMDGETAMYDIVDAAAPGGMRTLRWDYPSRTDCLRCHTDAAGSVLGVRTAQINRPFDYPSMTDNQLRSWNHIGMFHTNLSDPALYAAHPDPADDSLPVAGRARAYLDANCANCHRPGGGATTSLDLRHTTPTGNMNAIDVVPVEGGLGLTDPRIVKPGDPVNSVLLERMRRTDEPRMPPLASHVPDALGIELIEAWIDGL